MDAFFFFFYGFCEHNINKLVWFKYGYLVLKPLTRHYTLIPIVDPYFLTSNQNRSAGSAVPESVRVHGGSRSLFASAAQLQKLVLGVVMVLSFFFLPSPATLAELRCRDRARL